MSPSDSATHLYGGEDQPSGMPEPRDATPDRPDVIWKPMDGKGGLTFDTSPGGGKKLCLHTTETGWGWNPVYPYPPHFTTDYGPDGTQRKRWQHVDTRYGAYALKSGSSCGSANYQLGPVYQIEHIAWAKDVNGYPDAFYRGVAEEVAWHHEHLGVPLNYPRDWSSQGRMSCEQFREYSGVVGHVHAPAPNTHWDAPFDIPRLRDYVDELLGGGDLAELSEDAQRYFQQIYDSLRTDPDTPNSGDENPPGPKLFSHLASFHRWAVKKTGFPATEYDQIVARFNDKT